MHYYQSTQVGILGFFHFTSNEFAIPSLAIARPILASAKYLQGKGAARCSRRVWTGGDSLSPRRR